MLCPYSTLIILLLPPDVVYINTQNYLPRMIHCSVCFSAIRYLEERDFDFSYWPVDGQQGPSRSWRAEETYGLLNTSWNGWAFRPLLEALRAIAPPRGSD